MGQRGRRQRPNGLFCITCLRQARADLFKPGQESLQRSFILKLRDALDVERVESVPCLSLCPPEGLSVERRGKARVLSPIELDQIEKLFDPTRQLEFDLPQDQTLNPNGDEA
ncbi:MAG TPA: hypothetical protein PLZ57_07725 [Pseudobdellovibrionaceae bacterium]|nr:hypothetical protein [Pseudobdellovibrionaceae bacterium]